MAITSDWHIHSRNSCDEASLVVADLVREADAAGIRDYGLTDHLQTPYNFPDIAAARAEYLAVDPSPRFHFGVEVSCISTWELEEIAAGKHEAPVWGVRSGGPAGGALAIGMTEEDIQRFGIEYVVGGAHWPMYVPYERETIIRDYHRQNMFLATHPLVDIVAHPWWWMGHWQSEDGCYHGEPWFDDFSVIPQSMHDEFTAAAKESGSVIEINPAATFLNRSYPRQFKDQYLDYLAGLHAAGVRFSYGSDCHGSSYEPDLATVERLLASVGIGVSDLWTLPPRSGDAR